MQSQPKQNTVRAKVYASQGSTEEAGKDVQKLQQLPKSNDTLPNFYYAPQGRDLPLDFLDAFDGLSNVTSHLVETTQRHTDELERLWEMFQAISKNEQGLEQIEENARRYKYLEQSKLLSGITDKVTLKKRFENLKKEDERLYVYASTFYWTALNLFVAYRLLSTGMLSANMDESEKENVLKAEINKIASVGTSIVEGVPLIGLLIVKHIEDAVDYVFKSTKEKKMENMMTIINEIIKKKFPMEEMEEDIMIGVAKLTLVMSDNPEKITAFKTAYQAQANAEKGHFSSLYSWVSERTDKLITKQWPDLTEGKGAAAISEAVQDVTLLFIYLCVDYKAILVEKSLTFEQQIWLMLFEKKLDLALAKMGMSGVCLCGGKWLPRVGNNFGECRVCFNKKSKLGVNCERCEATVCISCYKTKKP